MKTTDSSESATQSSDVPGQIATAIRKVTAIIQKEMDSGRRSTHIDAHDLVDVLLAFADEIDPE